MLSVSVAQRVVRECLHLRAHERVVIVTDESPGHELVTCLAAAARTVAAEVVVVGAERVSAQPHGYLTWRPLSPVVASALQACDVAVFYTSTLMALSADVRSAAASGSRMLFIPADFDLRRPVVLGEDLGELDRLGAAVADLLRPASAVRVTSAEGTDLSMDATGSVTYDDCQVRAPGEIDFFPGGMWNLVPDVGSVRGVVRFTAALHPVGRLAEPVEVVFESGTVTSVRGGWQARAWERWLRSFGEAETTRFAHLSGGLAGQAQVIGHDWEDLIVRGSVLVAGGASLLYGGDLGAPAHFDGIVPNATLDIDGVRVLDAGEYDMRLLHHTTEGLGVES
jgi:2,5-dihydroxypyridine 5,6-dioxygenase